MLSSKQPSSIIRKWQRALPNKRMPSYTRLMEFLQKRVNGDDIRTKSNKTKESSYQYPRHRQNLPRRQTYTTTNRTLVCPTCHGLHEIKHCKIFKAKSATKRFEHVKRASLCTNCLGRGHSLTQCSADSCHICGQRHNTYLHRKHINVSSRESSVRSSNC